LLDKPLENVVEFEGMVFVVLISPAELPTTFCVAGDMIRKELEGFVSLELDCTMVAELMSLSLDEEALLRFPDNELLVNKANVSGSVNPVIESDEASNIERTLPPKLCVMGAVVVTNDSAIVIGSVEPTIGKLED